MWRNFVKFRSTFSRFTHRNWNVKFIPFAALPLVPAIAVCDSTVEKAAESNRKEDDLSLNFIFHANDIPKDFNFGRFVKLIFRNEEQRNEMLPLLRDVINKELDNFDFCYSFWNEEFGEDKPSVKSSAAAALFVKDGATSEESEEDEVHRVGMHIQVDFKADMTWVDARNPEGLHDTLSAMLRPSAPVAAASEDADGAVNDVLMGRVREMTFDSFLPTLLDARRTDRAVLVLLTTDNCPVCAKAKFMFPPTSKLGVCAGVDFYEYSLSRNCLPPGVSEAAIPGTPHYLLFPPLPADEAQREQVLLQARAAIGPHYRDVTRRDYGVTPSDRSRAAVARMSAVMDAAHESESKALPGKRVYSRDAVDCSDLLHALGALEVDPLEAIRKPQAVAEEGDDDSAVKTAIQSLEFAAAQTDVRKVAGALAAGFLMLQVSELKSNRDFLISSVLNTMDKHGFFRLDARKAQRNGEEQKEDYVLTAQKGLLDVIDKTFSEEVKRAESLLQSDPAAAVTTLKDIRDTVALQMSMINTFMDVSTKGGNAEANK